MKTKLFSLLCATVLLVLSYSTARSAMYTWVGGTGSQSWTVATNWFPIGVPGASDDAIFGAGAATIIDFPIGALSLNSIQITGRVVYFSPGAACALTLTGMGSFVTGAGAQLQFTTPSNLTVAAGATLTFSGNGNYFTNGCNTFINGTVNVNAGSQMNFIWGCVITVGTGGIINNAGTITLDHAGTSNIGLIINGGGTVNNTGTFNVGALSMGFRGTLRIVDNGTFTGNTPAYGVGSHLEYTGTVPKTVGTEFPTGVNMNGLVVVQNTGGVTLGAGAIYSIAGGLTLNAPLVLNTNTILDFVGGSVCWGAPIQGNATASMRILGAIAQACSCVSFSAPQELNQLVINASGMSLGSDLTINSTLTIGAGGVQLNVGNCGARTLTLRGGGSVAPVNGIRIQNGSVLNIEGNSALTGAGTVQYDAGSILRYTGTGTTAGRELPATMPAMTILEINCNIGASVNIPARAQIFNGTINVQGGNLNLRTNTVSTQFAAACQVFNNATLLAGGAAGPISGGAFVNIQGGGALVCIPQALSNWTGFPTFAGPAAPRGQLIYVNIAPSPGCLAGQEFPNTMNGDVLFNHQFNGNLLLPAGTKTVNGSFTLQGVGAPQNVAVQGTLVLAGTAANGCTNVIGTAGSPANLNVNGGATLRVVGNDISMGNTANMNITGTLEFANTAGAVARLNPAPINNITYNAGSTLLYTGANNNTPNAQELPAATPTNLTINKTGGAVVTLPGSRTFPPTGVLTLTSGILDAASFILSLGNDVPGALAGGPFNANTMIRGALFRAINTGVATGYLFPMGAGTTYLPVIANVPAGASGSITATAFASNSMGTGDGTTLQTALSTGEFWQVSGSAIPNTTLDFSRPALFPVGARIGAAAIGMGPGGVSYSAIGNALGASGPTLSSTPHTVGGSRYYAAGDTPPTTYTWNNAVGAWGTAGNWTPVRTTPLPNDILQFDPAFGTPAGNITVTAMPAQTIGKLIINRALATETVTLQGAGNMLTVQGAGAAPHVSVQAGTLDLGNTTGISLGSGTTQMRVANGATLIGNNANIVTGTGFFTLDAGATLRLNNNSVNGTFLSCMGAGSTFDPAANYVFSGGAVGAGFASWGALPAITQMNNLTLLGGTTVTSDNNFTINGILNAASGNFTIAGANTVTLNRNAVGNTIGATQSLNVDGTLVINNNSSIGGAGTVNYGTGQLQYTGNIASFFPTGIELPTPTMNRPVTINNTQGFNGGIALSFPTYFSSLPALTFISGVLQSVPAARASFTSSQLPVGPGIGTSSYIDGPMEVLNTFNSGNFTFPVGNAGQYLPLTINTGTGGNVANVEVEAFAASSSGTPGTSIGTLGNEYWRVRTTSGALADATINLNRSSVIPAGSAVGFNTSTMSNGLYNGQGGAIGAGITSNLIANPATPNNQFFAIGAPPPTIFYYFSGLAENPTNWRGNIMGGGGSASNFTTGSFYVPAGRNATFTIPTTFGIGTILQVESGGAITVPNGQTLTANGSLRINAGGRLTLQGSGNVVAPSGVQYLSPTAVLEYNAPANRLTSLTEFPDAMTAQVEIHSGSVRLNSSKHLQSTFLLNNSALTFGAANRLRLSQSATFLGTSTSFVCDSTDTLIVDGVGTLAGSVFIPQLARLTMNRSGLPLNINGTTRITQQLGLFAGNITVQPNESVIIQSNVDTALVGGNNSSFVNGALVRLLRPNLTPATAQPVFFPIGRNSTYLPLTLTEATTGTVAPYVGAEAQLGAAGGTPVLGVPGALSTSEFWRVVGVSGDFTGARVGVLRSGLTTMNSLAFSTTRTGLYAGLGGTLTSLAQGTSLLGQPSNNVGERFYSIVGTLASSPRITDFSPSIGGQGTEMTITGTNLTGVNTVAVGGVLVQRFTILNDSTIRVVLGPVASGPVQIGSPLGGAASGSVFTFVPMPVLSGVSPNPAGAGTLITIDGTFPGGVNGLIIGGVTIPQQNITVSQNGSLIVRIPMNATTSTITLSTPGGTLVSTNALSFVGVPRLISFSPAVAATGAIITLTGENFVAGTTVRFGAVPAQSVTVNSPTRMSVVVPSQPAPGFLADISKNSATLQSGWIQSVFLTVRTGGGTATSATQFVYSPTLNGGGIDPARLVVVSRALDTLVALGGRVRVTGANLELITELTLRTSIGSTKASYSLSSSGQITVIIPTTGLLRSTSASLSRAPVTVDALGSNNRAIANNLFTVIGAPTVTAIVPPDANVGEEVRVSGENLDLVTGASLGGTSANFRLVNGELFVRVPADARTGGALPVGGPLVLTSLGGIITTSAQIINAAFASGAPFIAGFSPTSGGVGTQIVVTGANFTVVTDASVGGIPVASFVINSSTRMTITLAADIPAVSIGSITLFGPFGQVNSLGQIQFPISLAGEQNALLVALRAAGLDLSSVIVEQEGNRIVGLQIRPGRQINANLATFAEQLSALTALKRLDLSNSGLTGAIPQVLTRLTQLESINLSGNALTGELLPGILCVYPNLRVLNLSRNRFEGEIPVCIALLGNVQELNLSDNRFQGSIPKEFGSMPNLAVFNVSNNRLSGGLPAEFGTPEGAQPLNNQKQAFAQTQNTVSMRVFDASGNQLTGSIPAEWGGMRGLQVLNLSRNRLSGTLPASVANWDALETLMLSDNRLEGIIPNLNVNRLQMLALQRNRFVGALPQSLSRAVRLRVVLLENNGFERLPQFAAPNRMDTMRVDTNRLEFGSLEGNLGVRMLSFANQDSIGRGGDTLLRAGSRFALESGIGGASTQYQWLRNGLVIQGATASTLTFQRVQVFQSGSYICRATNARFPGIMSVSRSVSVVVTGANSILSAPVLTFPPQNGENIAVRPRFLWSSVEGAEQYEIVVARDAALRDVVLRRTVSSSNAPNYRMTENDAALERGAQYFWRVRALALGSEGEMSLVQNFRVVPLGVDVAFSTVDVGRSLVGSGVEGEGVIVNVGTAGIQLDSARVETSTVFFIVRSSINRPLQPKEELPVQVRFTPNSGGEATANVRVWYKDGQQQPRQTAFTNALKGRGSALRIDAVEFEAVRVGRTALKAARVINVSNTPVLLRRLRVVPEGNSELGQESAALFTLDALNRDTLGAGDTLFTTIRCRSLREIDARARIEALWEAIGRVDSANASLTARVRFVNPDNPFVVLSVRPKVNRVPPGTSVPLEVFIAEGNLEAISQVASGNIRVRVAFDRNVLAPAGITRALRTTQGSVQALVDYSTQWDARRNGSVIGVFEARAVAGERDSTSLQIVGIEWGGQREERQEWERGVIIEEPQPGSFATLVSRAGGKRLIGVNQAGTVVLSAAQPNPATDKFQVRFTLAEESPAELVLVDALGNVLKTLARYTSAQGEYIVSSGVEGIPSGTYFVVLRTPIGVVSEQIQVRR